MMFGMKGSRQRLAQVTLVANLMYDIGLAVHVFD
jgi:hypothetical protein